MTIEDIVDKHEGDEREERQGVCDELVDGVLHVADHPGDHLQHVQHTGYRP